MFDNNEKCTYIFVLQAGNSILYSRKCYSLQKEKEKTNLDENFSVQKYNLWIICKTILDENTYPVPPNMSVIRYHEWLVWQKILMSFV